MSETVVQSVVISSTPSAFAWRDGRPKTDVTVRWVPIKKRKPGRSAKPKSIAELNAWFEANQEMVMADAEAACLAATGRKSL